MHVTACVAGQEDVDVEVGEACRSLRALKEAIVEALPKLCAEGFDVSVGGRALDDDEGVVSLEDSMRLDVVPNARGLSVVALREAGREVSEAGLLAAVADGDVALCTLYLDAGVPLDCANAGNPPPGSTPLRLSCRNGHVEVATLLLDRGSNAIDEANGDGETPLHLSCENGHVEVATLLLDRGSNAIDAKDRYDYTPLHHSCYRGHLQVATLLLDRGSNAIDEKGNYDRTPLHHSCESGHLDVATLLLDRGSTALDAKDRNGSTPLHACCEGSSRLELATLLLDRGSTAISQKDGNGNTPLHLACCEGHVSVATLLLERGASSVDVEKCKDDAPYSREILDLLSARVDGGLPVESAQRRRIGELS